MQMTKTHKIILSIIIVALLLGAYVYLDRKSDNEQAGTNPTATTTTSGTTVVTGGNGSYTIEQVPLSEGQGAPQPIPNLNRAVTPSSGAIISPEAKTLATQKVSSLQATLKKDPVNYPAWMDLGMYQKMGGDYEGASISWGYAAKLALKDNISRGNLGNLYAYFIKDNAKAETYYKQAIAIAPTQGYLYIQLAEVYRDFFKDINKARTIIDQGLSKIPNDEVLLQFKASLQ